MKQSVFPFTALVGQEAMKAALLLNAVDPGIGGVLIRGHKGTGKSTAVRALTGLLPEIETVEGCPYHCPPDVPERMHRECLEQFLEGKHLPRVTRPMPMVELPLGATEDRLVGTLHIERALQTGERQFEPGLLAAANRGILYVDEVNLLDDHLVDLLLDAAASGVNIVEREGVSYSHPARFMLVGTMNPEEGELRPQFLDRFGLCVAVKSLESIEDRREIVERHLAFENNPEEFTQSWLEMEETIRGQVVSAQKRLDSVRIPQSIVESAVRLAIDAKVQGHRAEITMIRGARSLAALMKKDEVGIEELSEAARLVLPHRMVTTPLDTPEISLEKIDEVLRGTLVESPPPSQAEQSSSSLEDVHLAERMQVPGSGAVGSILFSFLKKNLRTECSRPTNLSAQRVST